MVFRGTSLARFLQWLNSVSLSQENEEARRFHLFLNMSCPQDTPPPDFPRDSLHAQWDFLSKHVDTHEIWSQKVLSFLAKKEMPSSTPHTVVGSKVSEALQQINQKGNAGSTKPTGASGADRIPAYALFSLYVRWSAKPKTAYPMSPAKLVAVLKDIFGQNEVCFITDDLLRGQENGLKSGYTVIGAKPEAERHVAQPRTVDDSAFLLTIRKADRQPWRPRTRGTEPAAKRQRTQDTPSPASPSDP